MKLLLQNQNAYELFLLKLQEISGLEFSGYPSKPINFGVEFLSLPHPLNLKTIGVGCFSEDLIAVATGWPVFWD